MKNSGLQQIFAQSEAPPYLAAVHCIINAHATDNFVGLCLTPTHLEKPGFMLFRLPPEYAAALYRFLYLVLFLLKLRFDDLGVTRRANAMTELSL